MNIMTKEKKLSDEISDGIIKAVYTMFAIAFASFLGAGFIMAIINGYNEPSQDYSIHQVKYCTTQDINCDLIAGNSTYEFIMTTIPTVCSYTEIVSWLDVSEKAIIAELTNTSYHILRLDCAQSFYGGN